MPVYIALLRGINVGGVRIKMADLRDLFDELGYSDAKTLLQSGNVVFESDQSDTQAIVRAIEDGIQRNFDYQVPVVLRDASQMQAIYDAYPPASDEEPKFYHLLFLKETPPDGALEALKAAYDGPERINLRGDELYVYYVNGAGRSKLTTNLIERHLKVSATARNWNTVEKLVAMVEA